MSHLFCSLTPQRPGPAGRSLPSSTGTHLLRDSVVCVPWYLGEGSFHPAHHSESLSRGSYAFSPMAKSRYRSLAISRAAT